MEFLSKLHNQLSDLKFLISDTIILKNKETCPLPVLLLSLPPVSCPTTKGGKAISYWERKKMSHDCWSVCDRIPQAPFLVLGGTDLWWILLKPHSAALSPPCPAHLTSSLQHSPHLTCAHGCLAWAVSEEADLRQNSSFVSLKHLVAPITHSLFSSIIIDLYLGTWPPRIKS